MLLWKPFYLPGDLVWIESSDGRFFAGTVDKETSSHNYKPIKSGTRGGNQKIGSAMKKYQVHCQHAREIQPSAKGYQVLCAPTQLYPRKEGFSPPHIEIRNKVLKEIVDEKIRQRAGFGPAPRAEGDGGSGKPDLV